MFNFSKMAVKCSTISGMKSWYPFSSVGFRFAKNKFVVNMNWALSSTSAMLDPERLGKILSNLKLKERIKSLFRSLVAMPDIGAR